MSEMHHTVYRKAEGETTEWDDLQRKFGNLPPLEEKKDSYYADEEEDGPDLLEHATVEQLDELAEEGKDDERVLEEYRKRRIAEMKERAARERFGDVVEISRPEFMTHVTEASKSAWVAVYLYQHGHELSKLFTPVVTRVASKHKHVKFVKIPAPECIENYPERNVPTLLLYKDGECKSQIVTLSELGGRHVNADVLEWVLAQRGVLETEQESDPRETLRMRIRGGEGDGYSRRVGELVRGARGSDDDSDE